MASYDGPLKIYLGEELLGKVDGQLTDQRDAQSGYVSWNGAVVGDGGIFFRLMGEDSAEIELADQSGRRGSFVLASSVPINGTSLERAKIKGTGPSPLR